MGKPKAPKAPDPKATAAAQTSTNIGTAIANQTLGNVNQVTPDGSLTYSQTGTKQWRDPTNGAMYDLPIYTATQTLSDAQKAIKGQSDAAELNLATLAADQSGRLNDLLGKPIDISGAPAAADPAALKNLADVSRYEDALMARINPQLDRDRASLETRLANQGLQPGSEAYNRAIDEANRAATDARYSAILNAGQEQNRQFNLATSQANAQNNARSQYLNELYAQRNQPINEISALLSGAQVSSPNFVNAQGVQVPTVDYAGLVNQDYQNRLGAWQQNQANSQGLIGGVLGLGGKLLSLSDKRAKKDIEKVGELKGHGLYSYRYKGEGKGGRKHIGVMAQEVEKKRPDAVHKGADGLRRVDYGKLFLAGRKK